MYTKFSIPYISKKYFDDKMNHGKKRIVNIYNRQKYYTGNWKILDKMDNRKKFKKLKGCTDSSLSRSINK